MSPMDTQREDTGTRKGSGGGRDVLLILLVTIVCAVALRLFVIEAYSIPSVSMENTLLPGDLILVNKVAYGLRLPASVPFLSIPDIPRYILPLANIRRGDIIVFSMPGGVEDGSITDRTTFVKRCIAVAGDTIEIRHGRVFVNRREMLPPPTVRTPSFQRISYSRPVFPDGAGFTAWDYGPLRVPRRGDVVSLTAESLAWWQRVLEREGHRVDLSGDAVLVDGIGTDSYELSKDYCFVLGDNLENSTDSRMWGFVCEDDIVGEAMLVYWSSSPDDDGAEAYPFRNIRWSRLGQLIR